jgi:hypothetical protein
MYRKVQNPLPDEAWHVVRLHTSTHFFPQPQTKAGALAIFVASKEGDPAARREGARPMIRKETKTPTEAYQRGWFDGHYGGPGFFTENPRLAEWEGASDRLAYYLGHREGREARGRADSPRPGDAPPA